MKNEIATPFGLAMTTDDVKIFNAFVLLYALGNKMSLVLRTGHGRGDDFLRRSTRCEVILLYHLPSVWACLFEGPRGQRK